MRLNLNPAVMATHCKSPLPSVSLLQEITIFTLVEVVLKSDGVPLKYSALLKRPSTEK